MATIKDSPELDDGYGVHAPVGTYKMNAFGLYDIHGNVCEWCQNLYESSDSRVNRGGNFESAARTVRSSIRYHSSPKSAGVSMGCRPSRTLF